MRFNAFNASIRLPGTVLLRRQGLGGFKLIYFKALALLPGPSHSFQWYTAHRLAQRSKRRFPARRCLSTQKNLEETRRTLYSCGWMNPCWSFDHATTSSFQKLHGAITLRLSFNLLQPEETCGRRGKPSLPIRASSRTQLGMLKPGHSR